MTPEEEIVRAGKAKEILENEMFKEAFDKIESALLDGIRRSAFVDERLREKLSQRYASLHDIRDQLKSVVETGEMAEEQIRQASLLQRAKDALHLN